MRLDILQVPDCPNAVVLETRLALLLATHPHIEVRRHVVAAEDDAVRLGMTGSPTLLIDGADPFAAGPLRAFTGPCPAGWTDVLGDL
jgi:hypothetical protein